MTIVEQTEIWYSRHCDRLSRTLLKIKFSATGSHDPTGEVGIGIEADRMLGSISLYNTGQIIFTVLEKPTGKHSVLDARYLTPDEDVAALLDRFVTQIISLE